MAVNVHQFNINGKCRGDFFRCGVVHLKINAQPEILHGKHTAPYRDRCAGPLLAQKPHMMIARKEFEIFRRNKAWTQS